MDAHRRGQLAEFAALYWLRLQGWQLLANRWKHPSGEIDLVMRRGRKLAFIEVKARPDLPKGLRAVAPAQQQRISRAATAWLGRNPAQAGLEAQLDLVIIRPWRLPLRITHAWEPTA